MVVPVEAMGKALPLMFESPCLHSLSYMLCYMSTLMLFQTNCALVSHNCDEHGLVVVDNKTLICSDT
jgi:hypothetical protein